MRGFRDIKENGRKHMKIVEYVEGEWALKDGPRDLEKP